jgi:2-amino-4-hydroxy-6-hydroxymethyldihydropteridine diphosphokinase
MAQILDAARRLAATPGFERVRLSSVRETAPWGTVDVPAQGGAYLNAVAAFSTVLDPEAVLRKLLGIERALGRRRTTPYAPRTIDLDLLLYGDAVIQRRGETDSVDLCIPHPRLLDRGFVLEPLVELAPERRHPITGKTMAEHWAALRSSGDAEPGKPFATVYNLGASIEEETQHRHEREP